MGHGWALAPWRGLPARRLAGGGLPARSVTGGGLPARALAGGWLPAAVLAASQGHGACRRLACHPAGAGFLLDIGLLRRLQVEHETQLNCCLKFARDSLM